MTDGVMTLVGSLSKAIVYSVKYLANIEYNRL